VSYVEALQMSDNPISTELPTLPLASQAASARLTSTLTPNFFRSLWVFNEFRIASATRTSQITASNQASTESTIRGLESAVSQSAPHFRTHNMSSSPMTGPIAGPRLTIPVLPCSEGHLAGASHVVAGFLTHNRLSGIPGVMGR